MKYDIIAIGGAVEDQFIHTNEGVLISNPKDKLRQNLLGFEYGAKILVDNSESNFGGGAANAAVAFSRLGLRTAIIACIGLDQRGQEISKNFKRNKVSTKLLQTSKIEPTGFSLVVVAGSGEHVVFPVRGANTMLKISWSAGRNLSKSSWVYLTSLSGEWQKILHSVFSSKSQLQIAWNPGHVQLMAGIKFLKPYLVQTSILILNIDEALELLSGLAQYRTKKQALPENIEDIARAVHGLGPQMVLITNGDKGALVFDGEKNYRFKPKKIKKIINTIGVGDAFGSSFVAGLYMFGDIDRALELAGLNSARVVSAHGAQTNLIFKQQLYVQKN